MRKLCQEMLALAIETYICEINHESLNSVMEEEGRGHFYQGKQK